MSRALIFIDIQNDYFRGGAVELEGSETASKKAAALLNHFREKKLPVFHVKHHSTRKNANFFIPGTRGAEIADIVAPVSGETVIIKNFPNSFRNTELLELLKIMKITDPVFCGMMTHICIQATILAAFDLGFTNTVAWDACATRPIEFKGVKVSASDVHAASLAAITYASAKALSVSEIIYEVK